MKSVNTPSMDGREDDQIQTIQAPLENAIGRRLLPMSLEDAHRIMKQCQHQYIDEILVFQAADKISDKIEADLKVLEEEVAVYKKINQVLNVIATVEAICILGLLVFTRKK